MTPSAIASRSSTGVCSSSVSICTVSFGASPIARTPRPYHSAADRDSRSISSESSGSPTAGESGLSLSRFARNVAAAPSSCTRAATMLMPARASCNAWTSRSAPIRAISFARCVCRSYSIRRRNAACSVVHDSRPARFRTFDAFVACRAATSSSDNQTVSSPRRTPSTYVALTAFQSIRGATNGRVPTATARARDRQVDGRACAASLLSCCTLRRPQDCRACRCRCEVSGA